MTEAGQGPDFKILVSLLSTCLVWVLFELIQPGQVTAADDPGLTLSPDRQFAYAETLFQEQDFRTAEVEFKRFVHFFPADPRVDEAVFKTGMALFYQKQFHEAARHFNDLIREDPGLSSSFTTEAYFMQSRAFREMDNLGYARVTLQNLLLLTEDPAVRDQAYLDLAGIHIHASRQPGTDELDQALAFLENISADSPFEEQKNERISRIREVRSVPGKNPVLAGVFAVIPGGGFLYTGRFHDAAAAFIINTGLGLAAWKAFDQDNPALGGVITLVGSGFYSGSIYGSISAAHKHNHRLKTRILDRDFQLDAGLTPEHPGLAVFFTRPF
ncbi:MAG: tetratricopeptide repeat protein [Desulfotignum sp.]|nr:tetratricopeptide repeat protein [Desulfotignum sp.]